MLRGFLVTASEIQAGAEENKLREGGRNDVCIPSQTTGCGCDADVSTGSVSPPLRPVPARTWRFETSRVSLEQPATPPTRPGPWIPWKPRPLPHPPHTQQLQIPHIDVVSLQERLLIVL